VYGDDALRRDATQAESVVSCMSWDSSVVGAKISPLNSVFLISPWKDSHRESANVLSSHLCLLV